jgi:hypothetical protein
MKHQNLKNSIIKISKKYFYIFIPLTVIIFFVIRNNHLISNLKENGKTTKAFIYQKKSVGSKGTIRSFYRFKVNESHYEGYDDNENLMKFDSIIIIYLENNPKSNRSKEFVDNYNK